jgi:serine/threonine protein kinase
VLHQIGVGALGPVFRTYEPSRDRLVAVKVFRLDIVPEQAQALADELNRPAEAGLFHPSVVEPIAAGVEGTVAYRAEEYVAAESLDVAMRHYAPAPIERVLPFITQLAGAIDFARAAGVGHGALHPRDIFVSPDEARATGFGVVDALERIGVRAPVRRPYTAPERIEGGSWGTPADVFSLAAIAFELLTGRRPSGTGDRIGAINGSAGERAGMIHAVLARAMDENPGVRFPTALAFASALEAAASGDRPPEVAAAPLAAAPPEPARERVSADLRLHDESAVAVPTPGEFEVEDRLDPVHAALDDARSVDERPVATTPSLFDADAQRSTAPEPLQGRHELDVEEVPFVEDPEEVPEHYSEDFRDEDALRDREAHAERDAVSYAREDLLPERSRPAVLPIAVTLIIGLLAGFASGYFVADRGRPLAEPAAAPAAQPAPAGTARPYSDQAVTPPRNAPPSSRAVEPPPTAAEDGSAGSRAPAPAPAAVPAATTGRIVVQSTPSRASVTVNGRWRGRTPLTLDKLPLGKYAVRVVQPGYRIEHEEFALTPREAEHSMSVKLTREAPAKVERPAKGGSRGSEPRANRGSQAGPGGASETAFTGSLFVDSRPQGASVLLDGQNVGRTPLRLATVKIGTHVIRMELPEHRPFSSVARVAAGQEARVTGSLERYP